MRAQRYLWVVGLAAAFAAACGGGGDGDPGAPANGLVAYWDCDGDLLDLVGDAHGTSEGGFTYGVDRFGVSNRTWSFDGTDARVTVASPPEMPPGTTAFSISFWLWSTHTTFDGAVIHAGVFSCNQALFFTVIPSSTTSTRDSMPSGVWTHYVCTYDDISYQLRMYRNGQLVDETLKDDDAEGITLSHLDFGQFNLPSITHWEGSLDDIQLYDHVLSPTDILQLYADQSPP